MGEVLFAHVYGLMNAIPAPLPATVVDRGTRRCFIVRDGDKQALAYVYFEDESRPAIVRKVAHARRGIPLSR